MPTVTVHVAFPDPPPEQIAELRVIVEDIATADAIAPRLGEARLTGIRPEQARAVAVDVPDPDPRASYAVRVHADVDGSGAVSPGDFVSTQSHPVLAAGQPSEVTVPVRPVG